MSPTPLTSEDDVTAPDRSKNNSLSLEKFCKVYGDRAIGYNFSVITCESCKAFFDEMLIGKRFCQPCRLKRCLQKQSLIGIFTGRNEKEWIMREGYRSRKHRLSTIPENGKEIKKLFDQIEDGDVAVPKQVLVELVKNRLQSNDVKQFVNVNAPADIRLTAVSLFTEQRFLLPDDIIVPFNPMNQFPRTSQDNFYPERGIECPLVIQNCLMPIPQIPVSVVPEISTKWSGNVGFAAPITPQQTYTSEKNYLPLDAYEKLFADDKLLIQLSLMDLVGMTDLALRRIIIMAKELTFFKSSAELEIKLDILKNSKESKHYEEHKRFLTTFGEKWGKNEYIMLLLNAITLFSPFRTNLQDIQELQKIRQTYCDILRSKNFCFVYLTENYSKLPPYTVVIGLYVAPEAKESYQGLLKKLGVELNQLSQSLLRIYHGLDNSKVNPF
ncbi:Nuclear hormone receptor HR96 [Dirofilaria immitis]|nr:Nuclear hormone receptor HR96 [Dirofilaria immitis]